MRYYPIDKNYTKEQLDKINQKVTSSGEAVLVTTVLQNHVVLRMYLINLRTTLNNVKETLNLCSEFVNNIN